MNSPVSQVIPEHSHLSRKTPNRRERHRTAIRERLARSALTLFIERGFAATTIEDITNTADVGKGTFFNYFPGKEHILATFARLEVERVRGFVSATIHSKDPIGQVLYRLALALTEECRRNPAVVPNILIPFFSSKYCRQEMAAALEKDRSSLAELIIARQKRGEVRDDLSPEAVALQFHRALFGTVALWSLGSSKTLSDCLKEMSRTLCSGIKAQKDGSRE